jgi:hypothetical protein
MTATGAAADERDPAAARGLSSMLARPPAAAVAWQMPSGRTRRPVDRA